MDITYKIYSSLDRIFSPDLCNYDSSATVEDIGRLFSEFQKEIPFEYRNKAILEVGCGEGKLCRHLASIKSNTVIGIDISQKAVKDANKLANANKLNNCHFKICDAKNMHLFQNNQFDLIISYNSLEHFDNPMKVLEEMKRILKPGGNLVIRFTNWHSYYAHHMPTNIPWAHVLFSERTVMKHRNKIKKDHKSTFKEAGLNKMNYRKLDRLIKRTGLKKRYYRLVPTRSIFPKFLLPLTDNLIYIPFIGKYFISMVLVKLTK